MRLTTLLLLAAALPLAAQKPTASELIDLARKPTPKLREAITAAFADADLKKGTAFAGQGPDFIWAVETAQLPSLFVNDRPLGKMSRVKGSNLWYQTGKLKTGTSHTFHYKIDGRDFGGNLNVPAYGPDSYDKPGVPQGRLSEKLLHTSKIYDGATSDYWIYVPAQYNPSTPAALMVWQDGQGMVQRDGGTRAQIVFDNLTHEKKIPVMIHVFISPATRGGRSIRSIQYDTVDDTFPRFLRDEILPQVYEKYNIRRDAYSRAIAGNSSGGICAFNAAWQHNDQFSRVLSRIGSFTSIQWKPNHLDGGQSYPNMIRKQPKKNIRVWLQDGSEDLENEHGSWPLQNIEMANSLKMKEYDFHLSWGNGAHSGAHGNAELPEEMLWLWRGYDPAKAEQVYTMEESEKAKPLFRIRLLNRE